MLQGHGIQAVPVTPAVPIGTAPGQAGMAQVQAGTAPALAGTILDTGTAQHLPTVHTATMLLTCTSSIKATAAQPAAGHTYSSGLLSTTCKHSTTPSPNWMLTTTDGPRTYPSSQTRARTSGRPRTTPLRRTTPSAAVYSPSPPPLPSTHASSSPS